MKLAKLLTFVVTFIVLSESAFAREGAAYELVKSLTTLFGPRPAGSKAETAAAGWLASHLDSKGFSDVSIEKFPIKSWQPGSTHVTVLGDVEQDLVAVALGGSQPGSPIEADVIVFSSFAEFSKAESDQVRGKIVLINQAMERNAEGSGYRHLVSARYQGPQMARSPARLVSLFDLLLHINTAWQAVALQSLKLKFSQRLLFLL